MGRLQAALILSAFGTIGLLISAYMFPPILESQWITLLPGALAGIIAAVLVVRKPRNFGQSVQEGVLTGLITGAFMILGLLIDTVVFVETAPFSDLVQTSSNIFIYPQGQDVLRNVVLGLGLLANLFVGVGAMIGATVGGLIVGIIAGVIFQRKVVTLA